MARRGKNEGTIYKRGDDTWRAQVAIGGQRFSYSAKTRAECQTWLSEKLEEYKRVSKLRELHMNTGQFLESWIAQKESALRLKTYKQYHRIVDCDLKPAFGKTMLIDLTPLSISDYYTTLKEQGRGTRTIRLIHSVFHAALADAIKAGYLLDNPSDGVTLPRKEYREMKVLDEKQVNDFLITAKSSRWYLLYKLALATGMRQGELLGLKWGDINWDKSTIKVQRQASYISGEGIVFQQPKTRSGIRTIAIGSEILFELRDHQKQQMRKTVSTEWKNFDLIFCTHIGTPISNRNLLRDFKSMLDLAQLPDIRFHDLRHTAASLMLNRGVPLIIVSKILGHSKPSVTLDIYSHCISEYQYQAAQIMQEITTPMSIEVRDLIESNG